MKRILSVAVLSLALAAWNAVEAKYPTVGLVVLRFQSGSWKDIAVNSGKLELFLTPSDVKKS